MSSGSAPGDAMSGRWWRTGSGSRRAERPPSPLTFLNSAALHETLDRLIDSLCRGLAEGDHAGRTVTLKIRLRPFRTHTRSRTIEEPTCERGRIGAVAHELLASFAFDAPVRLLGVGVSNLERAPRESERGSDPRHAQATLSI